MKQTSTPSVLKVTKGTNASYLTTAAPLMIPTTQTPLKTAIRAKLGSSVHLPCQCGRWNNDASNPPPMWKDGRVKDIVITGPEVDSVPHDQRKYVYIMT